MSEDPAEDRKEEVLLVSLMGDGGPVLALTGENEGLGSVRELSPKTPIVGGITGGLPTEPSSGDGGKGRPVVKLLLRSRSCRLESGDATEPEDPEGPGLTASCELDALAARSEEGSGSVRFQYGINLVCEGGEEDGSRGSDAEAAGGAGDLKVSLAGLELLRAVSEKWPGAERGRGSGRLPVVGEVEDEGGRDAAGCCEEPATLDAGRELACEARL